MVVGSGKSDLVLPYCLEQEAFEVDPAMTTMLHNADTVYSEVNPSNSSYSAPTYPRHQMCGSISLKLFIFHASMPEW